LQVSCAPAAVLERLNPLLEAPPMWVVSERGDTAPLPRGRGFQLAATMTPPSLSRRGASATDVGTLGSELSPVSLSAWAACLCVLWQPRHHLSTTARPLKRNLLPLLHCYLCLRGILLLLIFLLLLLLFLLPLSPFSCRVRVAQALANRFQSAFLGDPLSLEDADFRAECEALAAATCCDPGCGSPGAAGGPALAADLCHLVHDVLGGAGGGAGGGGRVPLAPLTWRHFHRLLDGAYRIQQVSLAGGGQRLSLPEALWASFCATLLPALPLDHPSVHRLRSAVEGEPRLHNPPPLCRLSVHACGLYFGVGDCICYASCWAIALGSRPPA
jgi:hypothetical protein